MIGKYNCLPARGACLDSKGFPVWFAWLRVASLCSPPFHPVTTTLGGENFFFLQNSVLFPSLFSPFNSFVLPHLSIKMAADKDKMEVDGSPPPATAQAGPAATQVRWKNTKKKKKKKRKREMQSVNDDADGRWPRRFNAQCCLPVLSPSQARLKSPALDLREQRGALTY